MCVAGAVAAEGVPRDQCGESSRLASAYIVKGLADGASWLTLHAVVWAAVRAEERAEREGDEDADDGDDDEEFDEREPGSRGPLRPRNRGLLGAGGCVLVAAWFM